MEIVETWYFQIWVNFGGMAEFSTTKYVVGTQKNRLNETVFEHPKHML